MAIKVGNSYVSEAGYAYATQKKESAQSGTDTLGQLSRMFPHSSFTSVTGPFQGKGTNNISIAPNILQQMRDDPSKRLEYESLIYDCDRLQKSLFGQSSLTGNEVVSRGFIIDSNGQLSSWEITRSGGETTKFSCPLPKNDRKGWLARLLEYAKYDSSKPEKFGRRA